jgi:hypothetical protein
VCSGTTITLYTYNKKVKEVNPGKKEKERNSLSIKLDTSLPSSQNADSRTHSEPV